MIMIIFMDHNKIMMMIMKNTMTMKIIAIMMIKMIFRLLLLLLPMCRPVWSLS